MDALALERLRAASGLFYKAINENNFLLMAEAAVEYRAVLRLVDIDPDTGGTHDDDRP